MEMMRTRPYYMDAAMKTAYGMFSSENIFVNNKKAASFKDANIHTKEIMIK